VIYADYITFEDQFTNWGFWLNSVLLLCGLYNRWHISLSWPQWSVAAWKTRNHTVLFPRGTTTDCGR